MVSVCSVVKLALYNKGSLDGGEAVGIGGEVGSDGKGIQEELSVDFEALFGGLDAVEAVADPFGAFDGHGFFIALVARGDFFAPVVGLAEEEDGGGGIRADFAADLFEAVFEVGAVAAGEDDGEVEVEFCLALDEFVEAVGHFGLDVGVLCLFLDIEVGAVAEVDDVGAGEDVDPLCDAVSDFHEAGAAACNEGDRRFGVEEGVVHF